MRNVSPRVPRVSRISRVPRWALWISSAITFFALAMLVLAIVLGVRAGQEQLTLKHRQQVSSILEQAFSYHNQGSIEAARIAYEEVLLLDPDNSVATDGLNQLRIFTEASEQGGAVTDTLQSTAITVSPTSALQPTATTMATMSSNAATPAAGSTVDALDEQLATAQASFAAGRWNEAIAQLTAIQGPNPSFEAQTINELLFDAYVNLATERDNQNKYQEAVTLFDAALAIRADNTIRTERALVANYIDAITYAGADWERALTALRRIYQSEPAYRDVEERLQEALQSRAEELVEADAWCNATTLLNESIEIGITSGIVVQRDEYAEACETDGASLAATEDEEADAEESVADGETEATTAVATPVTNRNPGTLSSGTILYSAYDAASGRGRIMAQVVGSGTATLYREDAAHPALRQDGVRLLYHNLRDDMAGISAWDAATGLFLRFTNYAEDTLPSWSPQGNRFVFASNREGDRLWRIYVSWAEAGGETTTLSIGEAPAWHPSADQIAFRGCDNTGNRCGLWLMNGSGGNRAPLTTTTADTRPTWSPDGRYVVFMSNGRDGNFELYRVSAADQSVVRLTNDPAADLLPTVSPDGRWVAFASNRDGAWKLWGVPIDGGTAVEIAPIAGNLGSWTEQSIQWVAQ